MNLGRLLKFLWEENITFVLLLLWFIPGLILTFIFKDPMFISYWIFGSISVIVGYWFYKDTKDDYNKWLVKRGEKKE